MNFLALRCMSTITYEKTSKVSISLSKSHKRAVSVPDNLSLLLYLNYLSENCFPLYVRISEAYLSNVRNLTIKITMAPVLRLAAFLALAISAIVAGPIPVRPEKTSLATMPHHLVGFPHGPGPAFTPAPTPAGGSEDIAPVFPQPWLTYDRLHVGLCSAPPVETVETGVKDTANTASDHGEETGPRLSPRPRRGALRRCHRLRSLG